MAVITAWAQVIAATPDSLEVVSAVATQLADGTINVDEEHDKPLVFVDELDDRGYSCERLTIGIRGTRNLAGALLSAASQLDGWGCTRRGGQQHSTRRQ